MTLADVINRGQASGVLTPKTTVENPATPTFHQLAKIHKWGNSVQGHLIVTGIGSLLGYFWEWVDIHLKQLVLCLPGYIKDTGIILSQAQTKG